MPGGANLRNRDLARTLAEPDRSAAPKRRRTSCSLRATGRPWKRAWSRLEYARFRLYHCSSQRTSRYVVEENRLIGYRHLHLLRGFCRRRKSATPSPDVFWENVSFRNYADYAKTYELRIVASRGA
jgi:hypothetical protein